MSEEIIKCKCGRFFNPFYLCSDLEAIICPTCYLENMEKLRDIGYIERLLLERYERLMKGEGDKK